MVQIGQGRKEAPRAALLVADDDAALPAALDIVRGDDRTHAAKGLVHELLVHLQRVVCRLFEEGAVRDLTDVDAGLDELFRREGRVGKVAGRDKVRSELCSDALKLRPVTVDLIGNGRSSAVRLETPALLGRGDIEILIVDPLLVLWA